MKKYLSRLAAALLALALLTAPACALTVPQALELLEENYYFDIPGEAYEAQSLDELFDLLGDPYTGYMTAEEYASYLNAVEGTQDIVGIGTDIRFTPDGLLIVKVRSGGSALEAGLKAGDLIVAIDGVPCAPAGEEHRQLLLGAEGTKVAVTVLRDGGERSYTLTRRAIHVPNTEITLLDGGVGYVDCDSFGLDAGELFAQGLKKYDSQVDWWIVDLRSNPGGYVDSALEMLGAVNGPGRYYYFEDYSGRVVGYPYYSSSVTQKPLILLVNSYSASASEIVSAGVRDTGRGIIVGSRTFGKGIAQNVLDGETDPEYFGGDCLKVTMARFYTAGGSTTDKIGVIPTLLVDDGYTEAVAAALCGGSETTSSLCVMLGSQPFYVDPDAPDDVLCALLEAVPPQMMVFYNDGVFNQCTPAQAADKLGLSLDSRWFSDVEGSPYELAINAMGTYRLLNGTNPGVFSPNEQLTRAQLCVMLARTLNATSTGAARFSDVPDDAWYFIEVNAMAELGLVGGMGDGTFAPEDPLTQEQFLTIMGRLARYLNFALDDYGEAVEDPRANLPMGMRLALAPYSQWARSGVAVLAWGLEDKLNGSGDMLYAALDKITPSEPILRGEAATGIYMVLAGLNILP